MTSPTPKNERTKYPVVSAPKGGQPDPETPEIENIQSEEVDQESSPASFEVVTYPADFTLEVLVGKLKAQGSQPPEIQIPGFQRKFVWTQVQASKLIESFLLGLPVPAIFMYTDKENIQMVVDGQQRLKSVAYFFEGYFGPEDRGSRPVFRLIGLNENSPYLNKTCNDLETNDPIVYRKLKDAVLRAFIIKQLNPKDNTSVFHVFERLNTGGTFLKGQEIRNCVYAGEFNILLNSLNLTQSWRKVFGKTLDKRQRDVELILRFLALLHDSQNYEKPMKDFLSDFMKLHQHAKPNVLTTYGKLFEATAEKVVESLGPKPFHVRTGLNAAVFDSVFVAFAENLSKVPSDIQKRFETLKKNGDYQLQTSSATTDREAVAGRLKLARTILFG
jgi:hypothetical protein